MVLYSKNGDWCSRVVAEISRKKMMGGELLVSGGRRLGGGGGQERDYGG